MKIDITLGPITFIHYTQDEILNYSKDRAHTHCSPNEGLLDITFDNDHERLLFDIRFPLATQHLTREELLEEISQQIQEYVDQELTSLLFND